MIRHAVGAIVRKKRKFLMVHKIKIMDSKGGPKDISSQWDFPKGGVSNLDASNRVAILRELAEETGSRKYRIIKEFKDRICFDFPEDMRLNNYERQEITMFLVEYLGDGSDLIPRDEEIDEVRFFSEKEVLQRLKLEESREFFKKRIEKKRRKALKFA
ncbi:MAG: NUDIX domain-containing protein [Candidatus Odinarchaeota archaeon]